MNLLDFANKLAVAGEAVAVDEDEIKVIVSDTGQTFTIHQINTEDHEGGNATIWIEVDED